MRQSTAAASSCLVAHGATACTDVTGFGLLGHLLEMLTASGAAARLDPSAIPALDGAVDLLASGLTSSLHDGNAAALAALPRTEPMPTRVSRRCCSTRRPPAACSPGAGDAGGDCVAELIWLGYRAAAIGVVTAPGRGARGSGSTGVRVGSGPCAAGGGR